MRHERLGGFGGVGLRSSSAVILALAVCLAFWMDWGYPVEWVTRHGKPAYFSCMMDIWTAYWGVSI